jgi:hypothetical protein
MGPASESRGAKPRPSLASPVAQGVARRLDQVFDSLERLSYLGKAELQDYRRFRELFGESLDRIDRKIEDGRLKPVELSGLPLEIRYPGPTPRVGVFIGSFDPFQMTHIAAALRFLGSDESEADILFVVPDGSLDNRKPQKTDYRFRLELLKLQVSGILEPLIVPLDIGEGADTIGIMSRLISLHSGARLRLTHLLGSDVLPMAVSLLPQDLEAWSRAAAAASVELDFSLHVVRRELGASLQPYADAALLLGLRMAIDRDPLGTPSSTAFRTEGAFTLVLPTEAFLSRLELLFRYGMSRPWSAGPAEGSAGEEPDYAI